jgi:hypothetical protein
VSTRVLEEDLVTLRVLADAVRALPTRRLRIAIMTEDSAAPWFPKTITADDRRAFNALVEAQRQLNPPTITGATHGR